MTCSLASLALLGLLATAPGALATPAAPAALATRDAPPRLTAPAMPDITIYAEVGAGGADYAFRGDSQAPHFRRGLLDLGLGALRPLNRSGTLCLGTAISLLATVDRPLPESYSLLAFDALQLEARGGSPLSARCAVSLIRVLAPVNSVSAGIALTLLYRLGSATLGLRGRLARFEIDYEPHGTPPDTKYEVVYLGFVLSKTLHAE